MMEKTALELLAEQVGAEGAETDGILAELKKGAKDALADLQAIGGYMADLLKAKKDADDKAAADKAADKGDGDDDDDDAAGYEDMELAVVDLTLEGTTPGSSGAGEVAIDASKLVKGTVGQLRRLRKAMKAQDARIELVLSQNALLLKAIETGFKGIANQGATLAKAVADSRIAALDEPAPAITPRAGGFPRRPTPPTDTDKAPIGGSPEIETRALAKAQRTGKIDFNQLQTFKQTRQFVADPAQNATIRAEVTKVAETVR